MPARREADRERVVSRPLLATCVIAIVVGIVAAIRFFAARDSLWEDEIIAITHANQPLPSFFVEVLRNDIHPPLYFLQLDGWLALGVNSDRWALSNSCAWAGISLAMVFFVARAVHGRSAAWIATALFAVLPSFIWSAGTLRMYAAVPAGVLFVYFANRRWFQSRSGWWLSAAFVAEVALAYTHAVEFYFVAFIVLGSYAEAFDARRRNPPTDPSRSSSWSWVSVQMVFGLCALPLAGSALLRGSDAAAPDGWVSMATVGGALFAGWKPSAIGSIRAIGTLIFVLLVGCGVWYRGSRVRTLVVPVGALIVAILLSVFAKPIIKQPVFAANLLPFIVLGAAAAATSFRVARVLVIVCMATMTIAAVPLTPLLAQPEGYAAAARSIREGAVAGDVVVVPNVSVFWGIVRYAVGPGWGEPLSILPPGNASWVRLNDRLARVLGARAAASLGLVPDRDFVDSQGIRYVLDEDAIGLTKLAPHVWVVTRYRYATSPKIDPALASSRVVPPATFGARELLVQRFDRAATP